MILLASRLSQGTSPREITLSLDIRFGS